MSVGFGPESGVVPGVPQHHLVGRVQGKEEVLSALCWAREPTQSWYNNWRVTTITLMHSTKYSFHGCITHFYVQKKSWAKEANQEKYQSIAKSKTTKINEILNDDYVILIHI